jgi:O-antigen/teichoic acid export membrane protein
MNGGALWSRVRGSLALLRPGSFDLATSEGRSGERYRRAALASSASGVARVLAVATLFITIRIVNDETSSESFGLWLLLVTSVTLVGFADLGIGNGLLNVVADAQGRDDHEFTREAVASAFFALTGLALALGLLFALIYPHVSWASLYNVTGSAADEAGPATLAFVVCTLISLPLGIAQRVNHAYQRGWIANLWQALGSLLSLIGVLVAAGAGAGTPVLVAAMLAGPPLAYLVDSAVLFLWSRRDLCPRLGAATVAAGRRVLSQGVLFFVLATVVAVSYESDTLVIAHFLGVDQVELYAVPFRLFALAPAVTVILLAPLWPAYGEAVSRRDLDWVHRTLRRSVLLGAVSTAIPSLVLIPLVLPIIDIWLGGGVHPPMSVIVGMAAWATMNGIGTALAMFANGTGTLRLQVAVALAMGASNLVLSIVLVRAWGIAGPIWATVITQVVFGLVPAWFLMRRLFRRDCEPEEFLRYLERWSDMKPPEPVMVGE